MTDSEPELRVRVDGGEARALEGLSERNGTFADRGPAGQPYASRVRA
jgi:hypothetical protein